MKFAHLVEINDPLNPLIDTLTREQLWRGLVLRAEMPTAFVPYLDRCTILEKSELSVSRELQYGDLVVRDRVTYLPQQQVVYHVPQQKDIPESQLTMTIEEPEPNILFVRFEYDDGAGETENATEAMYNDFRRSAYTESDIDTIRTIREMAEDGRLAQGR
ncbi:MAG TPA: SRPBCC family protein [Noviherbaspirillum sp.]|uniref:SRPBCC family protein n=1 Tax=Noviherbaspirillum sp. TaxID=1926288 RepID=UPI002B4A7813|nr:SRPBCC family protein [Noviherbaspirillum sp.]HJV86491.1 SRPBCC family protein [Noviherbaspirillum sp.]